MINFGGGTQTSMRFETSPSATTPATRLCKQSQKVEGTRQTTGIKTCLKRYSRPLRWILASLYGERLVCTSETAQQSTTGASVAVSEGPDPSAHDSKTDAWDDVGLGALLEYHVRSTWSVGGGGRGIYTPRARELCARS